jgi:hypothetical protein
VALWKNSGPVDDGMLCIYIGICLYSVLFAFSFFLDIFCVVFLLLYCLSFFVFYLFFIHYLCITLSSFFTLFPVLLFLIEYIQI